MRRSYFLLPTALLAAWAAGGNQELSNRKLVGARVAVKPAIDGKLDDECWKSLPSTSGFSDDTLYKLAQDQTTVWLGYDDQNIYVAFSCKDPQPRRIVKVETKRGAQFRGEDRVRFVINPFNSKRYEDQNEFNVNPLGTQWTELAGGHADKQEWEGAWRSAAQVTSDGWTCEMEIPWKILARPRTGGQPCTVGINFERRQARTEVFSVWSNLTQAYRPEYMGEWTGVAVPEGGNTRPLSFLWYGYTGVERGRALGKLGADLRYHVNDQQTALLSINPDFSNVENAVTSIDFSYAEKLRDETRPFFLEGGGFFGAVSSDEGGTMPGPFASVQIPEVDVGAKYYGNMGGGLKAGLLATHVLSGGGRSDAVLHLSKAISPNSSASFTAVTRQDSDVANTVVGGGMSGRAGNFFVSGKYYRSQDRTGDGDAATFYGGWSAKAWQLQVGGSSTSPGYIAWDGYAPFVDERGFNGSGGYWGDWRSGPIRQFGLFVGASRYEHFDGRLYHESVFGFMEVRNSKQLMLTANASAGTFEQNKDHTISLGFNYPALDKYRNYGLFYTFGRQDSQDYNDLSAHISWRFFHRLSIGASSQIVRLGDTTSQHIVTLSYDIAKDQAIGGRLVIRDGQANGYLSYRKSGYGGTEYFLILGDPNAERFQARIVLKVVGVW